MVKGREKAGPVVGPALHNAVWRVTFVISLSSAS
jgi:hypothetical protein